MSRSTSICSATLAGLLLAASLPTAHRDAQADDMPPKTTLTVFAASSTTDVMTELAKRYEADHPVTIRFSFAAASVLARQIEQEAPCDVFLSADARWMDYLAEKQRIQIATRRDVAGNRLVIVTPADRKLSVRMEKDFPFADAFHGRLAMGDPAHVPAGSYAREALRSMGWWEPLKDRLLPAENVRAALKLVEMGEVEAGIVYLSDAHSSNRVAVAGQFPEDTHSAIRYPAALCVAAQPAAAAFLDFVAGREAASAWAAAGFIPLAPERPQTD